MPKKPTKVKKNIRRKISACIIYIQASFNNTLITLTDPSGNVLFWSSAGKLNFSGARKATPHAASLIMQTVIDKIKEFGATEVEIKTNGIGAGREAALRALASSSVNISSVTDITPVTHNGPRPPKARRV